MTPDERTGARYTDGNAPLRGGVFVKNGMAEWTGLEPATPGVTGRYSNQLNYHSEKDSMPEASGGC